jgi:hypothetical protein
MTAVFRDREGVLMVEFMQQWTAITSEVYCETHKKVKENCEESFTAKSMEC